MNLRTHTVQSGDSFQSIAAQRGITASELIDSNPYVDPVEMTEGDAVAIPCTGRKLHRVPYGQTICDLLRTHHVSLEEFLSLNPEFQNRQPVPGQQYKI